MEVLGLSSMILWTVVVTPVIYVVYYVVVFLWDVRRRGAAVDKFPGDPKHWLWGHLHLFPGPTEAGLAFLRDVTDRFPRRVPVWRGPVDPILTLTHPETMTNILKSSEPKPLGVGVYRHAKPWIGDGLLVSRGKKWARNRRLLTPAFHFDILKPYTLVNNEAVEKLIKKVDVYAEKKESFEFFSNVSLCTFDVILRCAMSFENDVQDKGENHPYVQAVNEMGEMWVERVLKPHLYTDFVYYRTSQGRQFKKHCDYVHTMSEKVIKMRQKELQEKGKDALRKGRYLDFLDILLTAKDEDGQGLSEQEIRDEVDTFMFEGHDTTASSISWTLYSLAADTAAQRKCQEEVDALLEGRESDDILWDDLPKLKYLTMCIKEAMRLHSPVPFIERETTKQMTIDGVKLPAGSILDIQIYNLHHNAAVWEDPMEFRPDRFLPENIEKMDSYAFIPFSAGPRNCIGQHFAMHEQKVVIARLLRRFNLELDANFPVKKKVSVVMKTESGMKLKVSRRIVVVKL